MFFLILFSTLLLIGIDIKFNKRIKVIFIIFDQRILSCAVVNFLWAYVISLVCKSFREKENKTSVIVYFNLFCFVFSYFLCH